ncbi:hypothetical protein DW070_14260 [Coprococcus catus]|uniref:Aldehyde oxidase/xanthine dehydrogenase a/b hammerhead domain-containing protein n=1 Tax=Coprococcus catus TaxID=116085 RepID=A0A3E2TGG7_9FIRM|nr:hypothetical protein DW070_14260 [Coprococcus catus]
MESYTGKGRGRVEGMDKATGRAVYAADYYEENMLHLAIVRSAYAHARVLDIDTSKVPETLGFYSERHCEEQCSGHSAGSAAVGGG